MGESSSDLSLDVSIGNSENSATLIDVLDSKQKSIEDELSDKQEVELLKDNLKDFISNLKERDQEIFKNRLLREAPMSLQAIADQYGVSRERIRQIEERLIKNLKVYMSNFIR